MTANRTITELYQALRPLLLRDVAVVAGGSRSAAAGMETHALNSSWHTGQLAETQAPWAATKNEWATALATHAALPDVHHAPVTAGTLIGLSGQQVSIASGAAYQFIGTGSDTVPEWRNVSELAGNGLTAANGVLAVGVANTGAVGLSVEADAVRLTTSSNPGAAASVLASDGNGYLQLVRLTTTDRLRTPILDTADGNLTLQPAGDVMLDPAGGEVRLAANRTLQSDNYASQTTGMRITHAGEGDFRYLFVDEMHAKSFIADLEQALAGGQIISKSVAVLASPFIAPAAGGTSTLVVRDLPSAPNMACFVSGDIVRLRQFSRAGGGLTIADCWGVVTAYTDNADGTQSWTFTRSSAPNAGSMTAGATVAADALVLDYGTTGNGFYEVNAIDGAYALNSPYAQIVSWTTHPATGQTVRSRLGNLRGIFGAANEYGLYAGAGTSTNDAYLRISNTEVGLYNLPLRMYTGSTERVHIAAHNDVWIGPSSADKRLSWDGSTLTIKGAIVVQPGSSGIGTFADAGALATANSVNWQSQVSGAGKPADYATVGADWGSNLSGRPTELIDGRIATAINSSGIVQSRVDPGANWGANPGAGVAGLLLGADYMGYWSGSAWRSYMDNLGRFYLNAGAGSNYLSWDGSQLTVSGAINVVGGNAATLNNVTGAINLVANASFEEDTNSDGLADGFSIYNNDGGAVSMTASRVAGAKSTWAQRISWTGTNASTKGIYFNLGRTKRSNVDYVLSFWARTNTAVNLALYEDPPYATQTTLIWPQANTTWQFYAVRLHWSSTPADNNLYLSISDGAAVANGWIEFDNVMVVEGSEIVPWTVAPSDKANTSLDNSVISTLINGANIRVGSGTKDSTLNGWNIDLTEIVGQANGVDQVVLDTSGQIAAGGGNVILNANGVTLNGQSYSGSNYDVLATRPQNKSVNFNISNTNEWSIWNWYNASTNTRALSFSVYPNNGVWETVLRIEEQYNAFITRVNGELNVEGRLLATTVGYDWSDLTPQNNWSNYGSPNATFGVKRFGNMVSVKGRVRANAAISANTAINSQLAAEYRPSADRSFACMGSIGGAKAVVRVVVDASGYIRPQDGFSNGDWLSVEFTYFTGG